MPRRRPQAPKLPRLPRFTSAKVTVDDVILARMAAAKRNLPLDEYVRVAVLEHSKQDAA